jgi:hypothetical protein
MLAPDLPFDRNCKLSKATASWLDRAQTAHQGSWGGSKLKGKFFWYGHLLKIALLAGRS